MNMLVVTFVALLPISSPAPQVQKTPSITASLSRMEFPIVKASTVRPRRTPSRKSAGVMIGTVGGLIAGGWIGAQFTKDCGCDDPGMEGMMIGAPIGAFIGGILGFKYF